MGNQFVKEYINQQNKEEYEATYSQINEYQNGEFGSFSNKQNLSQVKVFDYDENPFESIQNQKENQNKDKLDKQENIDNQEQVQFLWQNNNISNNQQDKKLLNQKQGLASLSQQDFEKNQEQGGFIQYFKCIPNLNCFDSRKMKGMAPWQQHLM
ncbi:hypothetical protein PPERSA_07717 [Pseudocohnilembus persalinus]|uniref:Uncharacterized protein n=1 Tax=Pseudocohnilembus persalinus TaxID=266149 RepID=A0A0V0RAG4_PSEPJ|nr:hypothetical protein PPERSA_07717 [Pseudocohnilembus persalinus]|eukprot:KRX11192.1 hypothetical protein PPERSA_07717 [Pseudocohnilembus persalinus]